MAILRKLLFFTILGAALFLYGFSVLAQCQCCYCDSIVGGICIINGQPSGCVGCLGTCSGTTCIGYPGQYGCGAVIAWCRDSDCGGGGPSRPCGDCIPSGCGFTALPLEKKFVIDNKTSEKIQQLFQQSVQFNRLTIAVENSSGVSDGKTFLASIFEPSLKTIRNFLSRLII